MFERKDFVVGIAAILLGIGIFVATIGMDDVTALDPAGPAAMPRILAAGMILLGVVHAVGGLYVRRSGPVPESLGGFAGWLARYKSVLTIILICLAYALLLKAVGYLIMTPLLILSILWVLNYRRAFNMVRVTGIMTVALYVVFRFGLQVKLPAGFWEKLF